VNKVARFSIAVLAGALLSTTSVPAHAETTTPLKLFGGYSFLASDDQGDLHGGVLALDVGLAGPFALVLDASAHHRGDTHMNESSFLVGPGLFFDRRPVQPFLQVLVGLHRFRYESHLGFLFGGGLDMPLGRRWSLRGEADYLASHQGGAQIAGICVQGVPDCFGSPTGFTENDARLSIGVVYSPGRR
jgi:hypothetical protein